MEDTKAYGIHDDPFDSMPVNGDLATLKLYWKCIASSHPSSELPKLALLMLDIKPQQLTQRNIQSHGLVPLCKAQSTPVQDNHCHGNHQNAPPVSQEQVSH